MVPSAKARFTTSGMSTSVERATPNPSLKLRSKKPRRVRMLKCCIELFGSRVKSLLFLEPGRGHQHGNHAADTRIVKRTGNAAHSQGTERGLCGTVVSGVQEIDRCGPMNGKIRLPFTREQYVQEIVRHKRSIRIRRPEGANGTDEVFQRSFDFLHRPAVAAEQIRVKNNAQHVANLALGTAVLPGQHALMHQVCFRREIAGGVIIKAVL